MHSVNEEQANPKELLQVNMGTGAFGQRRTGKPKGVTSGKCGHRGVRLMKSRRTQRSCVTVTLGAGVFSCQKACNTDRVVSW